MTLTLFTIEPVVREDVGKLMSQNVSQMGW